MNKLFTKVASICLGLAMAVGVGVAVSSSRKEAARVDAKENDLLKTYDTNSSTFATGYGRKTGDNFVFSGQKGYLGINKAANNDKVAPSADDLPVIKGVNSSATTSTYQHYFLYTSEAVSNVGKVEFIYSGTSGDSTVEAYLLYSSTASTSGSTTWTKVTLSSGTGLSAQGTNVASNTGTYTFKLNSTETSAKYYGMVFVSTSSDSFWRATGAQMKLYEGATSVPVSSLTVNDGTDHTGNFSTDVYEGQSKNLTATVGPNNASETGVTWTYDNNGNVTCDEDGQITAGAFADGASGTVVCTTVGRTSQNQQISIIITINILQDQRSFKELKIEGNMSSNTYFNGDAWDTSSLVFKAVFTNESEELITGSDLDNNLEFAFYKDSECSVPCNAAETGMTSVFVQAIYVGDFITEDYEGDGTAVLELTFSEVQAVTASYSRTAPVKDAFTTKDTFTYGGTITETWNNDPEHPVLYDEDDAEVTFEIQTQGQTHVADVTTSTKMLAAWNNDYVSVKCKGVQVGNRYKITVAEAFDNTEGEYYLGSQSDIKNGAHIILTSTVDNSDYAMGDYVSGNNCPNISVDIDSDKNIVGFNSTGKEDVADIELVAGTGSYNGYYNLKLETGNYLYAAGGTGSNAKNNLKGDTSTINGDKFYFSITVSNEGAAVIKAKGGATKDTIRFNSANNPRIFSCYAENGQNPINLYVFRTPIAAANVYAETFIKGENEGNTCSAIKAAWESLETQYTKLLDEVREIFEDQVHESYEEYEGKTEYTVGRAVALYDQILIVNGTSSYNDFMGRTAPGGKLQLANVVRLNNLVQDSNFPLTVIIIISAMSLAAVASFAIISKRKHR